MKNCVSQRSANGSVATRRKSAASWSERRKNWRENHRTFSITSEASSLNDYPAESDISSGRDKNQSTICGVFSKLEIERAILTVDGVTSGKHEEEQEILNASQAGDSRRVVHVLRNCNPGRKATLLTVAVLCTSWHGNLKLLRLLLENGGDPNAKENDARTALHLAATSNSVACIQLLLSKGANVDVWDHLKHSTPLGSAAASQSSEAVELLISSGADPNAGLADSATATNTPLTWATRAGSQRCVQILIEKGALVNCPHVYTESPVHIASSRGDAQCLQELLEAGADVRNVCGSLRNTPLHLAAEDCSVDCVKLLLTYGGDVHATNTRLQTPLHLAALSQASEVVTLLVKAGAAVDTEDLDKKTPLHYAIVKTSRCTDTVLNLILSDADVNKQDKYGYSALHLAALNEHSTLVSLLIQYNADITAKTKGGATALGLIARRTPDCIATLSERLDSAISTIEHDALDLDCDLKVDFRFIVPKQKSGESLFFMALIQSGQRALLQHPICRAFLHLKWFRIRKLFFVSLTFYALFVLLLSVFIMETYVLNPFIENGYCDATKTQKCELALLKKFPAHHKHLFCSNGTCPLRRARLRPCNTTSTFTEAPIILEGVWWFLLVLLIIFIVKEIFQLVQNPREYICNWENWVQILVVSLTGASVYGHKTFLPCPEQWQYHTAGLVMVLAWTQMMLVVGRFPGCGLYVQMFHKVAANVLRFILVYLCMVVGFSLGMAVLFPGTPSLNRVPGSLLTTLVMMVGEMNIDILFEGRFYEGTGHFVFFAFVILIVIVLMNLLVGLAVSDIQGLQRSAGLSRLVRQARLIDRLEAIVFSPWSAVLPRRIREFLQSGVLLVPSTYKCVFSLRPNDPRDQRLPRDVKEGIQRVAVIRQKMKNNRFVPRMGFSRSLTTTHFTDDLSDELTDIFELVQKLNDDQCLLSEKFSQLLQAMKEMKKEVVEAVTEQKEKMEETLQKLGTESMDREESEECAGSSSDTLEDIFMSIDHH